MAGWTVVPNQNAGADTSAWKPVVDPASGQPMKVSSSDSSGLDLSNKAGQGTYNMWDTGGKMHPVPYSLVPVAHSQGFQFDTNPSQGGLTPAQQFVKDSAADPQHASFWSRLTSAVDRGAQTEPYAASKGIAGNAKAAVNNLGAGAVQTMLEPIVHPVETAKGLISGIASLPTADGGRESLTGYTPPPAVKPTWGQAGADLTAMVPGTVLANEAAPVAADAAGAVARTAAPRVANAVRTALAGDVNAPIPGTDVTPAARYQSMRSMGIQPNAAEATNSTPLKIAEKVNQNSLTSAGTYSDARAANLKALNDYTEHVLDSMSTKTPEEGGAAVQQGLLKSHADLKTAATQAYKDLDSQVGDQPLAGTADLRRTAQEILEANAPYYKLHPELEPTKAMSIVRDLAGAKGSPRPAPAVIPGFGPAPAVPEPAPPPAMTYSELHRLRSDLLDFNNTNPDLVKNQANGWISRLAGMADHAITSSESALTPEQVDTFRNANDAWKFMKDTFDNPSHPVYQAVRTKSPSTLVNGISKTPEMANTLRTVLEPEELGAIQRGVAESLLRSTKEGGYNFKTFQGQWNKLPHGYREALFSPEQRQELENIGNAGTVLNTDLNPSGSARLGQGIAEGAEFLKSVANPPELLGNLAYHGGQYWVGRMMNSPRFVDWLMRGRGFAPMDGAAQPGSFAEARAMAGSGAVPTDRGQPVEDRGSLEAYRRYVAQQNALLAAQRTKDQ